MDSILECSFDTCTRRPHARGLCGGHYSQLRKGGPLRPFDPRFSEGVGLHERFWAKVDKSGECWVWTGARSRGYGHIGAGGKVRLAHRLAWEFANGAIPDGLMVDHMCHNRACVRADHMQLTTNTTNSENRSGPAANSKSGVRGVCWYKQLGRWHAQVRQGTKTHHVGYFHDIREAEAAVIAKRNELFTNNLLDRGVGAQNG